MRKKILGIAVMAVVAVAAAWNINQSERCKIMYFFMILIF